MKHLGLVFSLIVLGLSAQAAPKKKSKRVAKSEAAQQLVQAASQGETFLTMNDVEPPEARKSKVTTSVGILYGTIAENNNYVTGTRLNVVMIRPSLAYSTENTTTYGLNLPMSWITDQGSKETRLIGRPELSAMFPVAGSESTKAHLGLALRLPFFDASTGGAELNRIWRVGPQFTIDQKVGDGSYAVIGAASAAYDTNYSTVENSGSSYSSRTTYERAPFAQGSLGLTKNYDTGRIGTSLNARYGFGRTKLKFQAQDQSGNNITDELVWDMNPPEMSWLEIFGNKQIAPGTYLTGSLLKSIKTEMSFQNILSVYDEVGLISSLAVSLGLSQTF